MNIGLDIDNVITAFDNGILKEFLLEDKNKRNTGIVKASWITGMFDWSKEEIEDFFANNMERIAKELKPRRNCKKYMDKLLEDGHKLILISHRAYPHYLDPKKTTLEWLEKNKINYSKLILSETPDKTKECKENNVDIMVDDRIDQCRKMGEQGIDCIVMITKYNRRSAKGLPFATSWENLYEKITRWNKEGFNR